MNTKYKASGSFERLITSKTARLRRAEAAIRAAIGRPLPIDNLRATSQASASVGTVQGVQILVSYSTVVAYKLPDGSSVATERNEFSKTTDRSVDSFCRPTVRAWQPEFDAMLKSRLSE
jgi:hypothetical protein